MLSRMGPLLPLGLVIILLPDGGLSKLTKSGQNHFKARIECYWSLVTMFDQKKEAMKFAINLAILKLIMLSDHAKCIFWNFS